MSTMRSARPDIPAGTARHGPGPTPRPSTPHVQLQKTPHPIAFAQEEIWRTVQSTAKAALSGSNPKNTLKRDIELAELAAVRGRTLASASAAGNL